MLSTQLLSRIRIARTDIQIQNVALLQERWHICRDIPSSQSALGFSDSNAVIILYFK